MWWITAINLIRNSVIPFLQAYWKPLLIGFCVVMWSLGCVNYGKRSIQSEWDKSIQDATVKAHQIEADNAIFSNVIGGKHEARIKIIDDNYNTALASLQSTGGDMPTKTFPSGKPNATAINCGLSESVKRKLATLAYQADRNTAVLIDLQEWQRGVK